ncbi:uncharacterized protein LOC113518038 [Galleria mellonella]|uniref:Uncharacterized protein LOC113518038 n=1 Tax=Galleria mellonella TaxID=7137 RepID=A0A6J1WSG8_GALME|nr:uncharacterized protein LOC113518038 [Galleria mellonella]
MKMKTTLVLLLLCCVKEYCFGTNLNSRNDLRRNRADSGMDVSDFSIYYDINTNKIIKKMMPRPWYSPGWSLRLPFTGGKCNCDDFRCECCTGIRIESLSFDRRTCAVLTFEPTESTLDLEVKMNNDSVYRNTFSARNPPPFCVPIPVPYLPPGLMDMCIRLFDINIVEQKLHVCMDMDTRIDKAPILILHFDCMDMGLNGIGLSKPGSNGLNQSSNDTSGTEQSQLDSDVYDPVTEDTPTTTKLFQNSIKYI